MINVTNHFYLDGAKFRDFCPPRAAALAADKPNFEKRVVIDATPAANAQRNEDPTPPTTPEKKSHVKRWLMIAAWIIGMVSGLTLAIVGACTANPLAIQLGTLIMTAFTGIGAKVVEHILTDK